MNLTRDVTTQYGVYACGCPMHVLQPLDGDHVLVDIGLERCPIYIPVPTNAFEETQ